MNLYRCCIPELAFALVLAIAGCNNASTGTAPLKEGAGGGFVVRQGFGLNYFVYVPSSYSSARAVPLVVFLHGCLGDALEQAQTTTGWSDLAQAQGFIAVFPQAAAPERCWFFTDPAANSKRDSGETAAIAGITRQVMAEWNIDPKRVYLDGFSAGGTMVSQVGAAYPDLYAAIGMVEGCPYLCVDDGGQLAYQAMGTYARVMPVFIVSGTFGGFEFGGLGSTQQWLGTDDLADDGTLNFSIPRQPATTDNGMSTRGFPYWVQHYNDAAGVELIQFWLIGGMYHEYPAPGGDLPGATAGAYQFFIAHPFN